MCWVACVYARSSVGDSCLLLEIVINNESVDCKRITYMRPGLDVMVFVSLCCFLLAFVISLQHQRTNQRTMAHTSTARVYVGTYGKYNSGSIAGAWIDLDGLNAESFAEAIAALHADEADPEYMFQDREGFAAHMFSESGTNKGAWEAFEQWSELDEDRQEAFEVYLDMCWSGGLDGAFEAFEDAYQGKYDSGAAFAEEIAEELGEVPKDLPSWIVIDWEASWNSGLSFDYYHDDETGHTFRNI